MKFQLTMQHIVRAVIGAGVFYGYTFWLSGVIGTNVTIQHLALSIPIAFFIFITFWSEKHQYKSMFSRIANLLSHSNLVRPEMDLDIWDSIVELIGTIIASISIFIMLTVGLILYAMHPLNFLMGIVTMAGVFLVLTPTLAISYLVLAVLVRILTPVFVAIGKTLSICTEVLSTYFLPHLKKSLQWVFPS